MRFCKYCFFIFYGILIFIRNLALKISIFFYALKVLVGFIVPISGLILKQAKHG